MKRRTLVAALVIALVLCGCSKNEHDETTADADYAQTNGTLAFSSGELARSIPVTVFGDINIEDDETVTQDGSSHPISWRS